VPTATSTVTYQSTCYVGCLPCGLWEEHTWHYNVSNWRPRDETSERSCKCHQSGSIHARTW